MRRNAFPNPADRLAVGAGRAEGFDEGQGQDGAVVPELLFLTLAIAASCLNLASFLDAGEPSWAAHEDDLTLAGIWMLVAGNRLFWFLLTRLFWKHLVWWRFSGTWRSAASVSP